MYWFISLSWTLTKSHFGSCAIYFHRSAYETVCSGSSDWDTPAQIHCKSKNQTKNRVRRRLPLESKTRMVEASWSCFYLRIMRTGPSLFHSFLANFLFSWLHSYMFFLFIYFSWFHSRCAVFPFFPAPGLPKNPAKTHIPTTILRRFLWIFSTPVTQVTRPLDCGKLVELRTNRSPSPLTEPPGPSRSHPKKHNSWDGKWNNISNPFFLWKHMNTK